MELSALESAALADFLRRLDAAAAAADVAAAAIMGSGDARRA